MRIYTNKMADLDIKTRVTGPDEINVELVRSDYIATSNIFRVFFEIFLALSSALVGVVMSVTVRTTIHWVFLSVVGVSTLSFLILSLIYSKKGKTG